MKKLLFLFVYSTSIAFGQSTELSISLESLRQKHNLPSLTAAFYQNGEMKEIASVGLRKIDQETKTTINDKFHLGSCTKSMTVTLIAMFIEAGKISWETTLPEMFPDLKIHPDYKNVNLEMLLTHRSGMYNGIPFYEEVAEEFKATKTAYEDRVITTKHLLQKGPKLTPNTKDEYNNTAYVIAAHAIERIAKDNWESLIQKRIFEPLKMEQCGFGSLSDINAIIPSQPWGHFKDTTQNGKIVSFHRDNPEMWGPAGRVHCTLQDWSKYLQMHIDGFNGVDSLLSAKTFKKLHAVSSYSQMNYATGGWFRLERNWAGGPALTHTGTNLVNYARVWLAPEKKVAMMVVTNLGGDQMFTGTDETLDKTGAALNEVFGILIDRNLRSNSQNRYESKF